MKSSRWRPAVKRAVVRKGITATAKLALELRASLFWELIWLWREKDVTVFVGAAREGVRKWSGLDIP